MEMCVVAAQRRSRPCLSLSRTPALRRVTFFLHLRWGISGHPISCKLTSAASLLLPCAISPPPVALGIKRDWITEHSLLALHVWIFHNRFKVDYNVGGEFSGRRMQEQLFERFWEDTTLRIRNAGVSLASAPLI